MTQREQYISNVKKGIEVYAAMAALKDNESIYIKYGKETYEIRCSIFIDIKPSYSILDGQLFGRSMNINLDLSTKVSIQCYTYDLFKNLTVAKVYFQDVTITTKPEDKS
jgi:hypothetical protein